MPKVAAQVDIQFGDIPSTLNEVNAEFKELLKLVYFYHNLLLTFHFILLRTSLSVPRLQTRIYPISNSLARYLDTKAMLFAK